MNTFVRQRMTRAIAPVAARIACPEDMAPHARTADNRLRKCFPQDEPGRGTPVAT